MRYFITASKDATIYSGSENQNTGIDQILEVSKWNTDIKDDYSRALLQFDYNGLSALTNPTFSLKLTSTELREIPLSFDLEILPVSQSWEMGIGKRQDDPITTTGVSWNWRDFLNGNTWGSGSDAVIASGSVPGGLFYPSPVVTFPYEQKVIDLNADITSIVNAQLTGSLTNNGLIVTHTDTVLSSSVSYGTANFFSSETHTIYRPKLIVEYDDIENNPTGSISTADADNVFANISNLKRTYVADNTYKFEIFARDEFPSLSYESGSNFSSRTTDLKYLPTGSQYSVVDNVTGDVIVPFGEISKVSSNATGSFFKLNFKGWEPERTYRIKLKVDDGENINIIDKNFTFKLIE